MRIWFVIFLLIPIYTSASNFMTLCESGDPDTLIATRWILKGQDPVDRCQESYQILKDAHELNLSCLRPNIHCRDSDRFKNIEWLREFKAIQMLNLAGHDIDNMEPLSQMSELIFLELSNDPIRDFSPLAKFHKLENLALNDNIHVTNQTLNYLIEAHPPISFLFLKGTRINNLEFIKPLNQLKYLDISSTQVKDILPINNNLDWQGLFLDDLGIVDLSILASMPRLRLLSANHNQLTNINGLEKQPALQTLSISENKITDLTGLAVLKNLRLLFVAQNSLASLNFLSELEQIYSLSVESNDITDLSPIKELNSPVHIGVKDNPVSYDQCENQLVGYKLKEMICRQLN